MQLYHGDCLDVMKGLPSKSVDLILADLPYGSTKCRWDTPIPLFPLWRQYKRIRKPHVPTVLFCSGPFTAVLIKSNIEEYKYSWVWNKTFGRGHLVAKYRPMQQTEDIAVFGDGRINYYPQVRKRATPVSGKEYGRSEIMGGKQDVSRKKKIYKFKQPSTLLTFLPMVGNNLHPTQKPVPLLEYLIKTYTQEGDTVLDNTMGSGSTGVACVSTGRQFIGIEKDEHYFQVASERIGQ